MTHTSSSRRLITVAATCFVLVCLARLPVAAALVVSRSAAGDVHFSPLSPYENIKLSPYDKPTALGSALASDSPPAAQVASASPLEDAPLSTSVLSSSLEPTPTAPPPTSAPACGSGSIFDADSWMQVVQNIMQHIACSFQPHHRHSDDEAAKPIDTQHSSSLGSPLSHVPLRAALQPPTLQSVPPFAPLSQPLIQPIVLDANNAFRLPAMAFVAANQSFWFNISILNMDTLFFMASSNTTAVQLRFWRRDYATSNVVYTSSAQVSSAGKPYAFLAAMLIGTVPCLSAATQYADAGRGCDFLLQVSSTAPVSALVTGTLGYMLMFNYNEMVILRSFCFFSVVV